MKPYTVIDIETIRQPDLKEPTEHWIDKHIRQDLKKPEIIERHRTEARAKWYDEAALDHRRGCILCVGLLAGEADEPLILYGEDPKVLSGPFLSAFSNERDMLVGFWDALRNWHGDIVGFSIREFDWPYLQARSAVHGLIPSIWPTLAKYRLDMGMVDWREISSNWNPNAGRGWRLEEYAYHLNLQHQPTGRGGQMAEWYEAGEHDKIIEHLKDDLFTTRDLHEFYGPSYLGKGERPSYG